MINKPVLIIIVLLVMSPVLTQAIPQVLFLAVPAADACETPISDRELFKKYYICEGGWCKRSLRGK